MDRCLAWTYGLANHITSPQNRRRGTKAKARLTNRTKDVDNTTAASWRFEPNASHKSSHSRFWNVRLATTLSAVSMAFLSLFTGGCATSHANLHFTAPSKTRAGIPFTVTVTVMIGSERDTIVDNRVHFASSDPTAVLPGDYYFTPTDAGSHTWTNGFVLATPGNQTISGQIIEATGISGSATVAVAP